MYRPPRLLLFLALAAAMARGQITSWRAQEYLTKNPAAKLTVPARRESCKRFLNVNEYHDMLGVLFGRDLLIFKMFVLCAFRPGELFALRWRCFHGNVTRVEESVFQGTIGKTKTRASAAEVVIPVSLASDLELWFATSGFPGPDDLIFPSSAGTPIVHQTTSGETPCVLQPRNSGFRASPSSVSEEPSLLTSTELEQ